MSNQDKDVGEQIYYKWKNGKLVIMPVEEIGVPLDLKTNGYCPQEGSGSAWGKSGARGFLGYPIFPGKEK